MEKPCEICGNIGFVDALKICFKCKSTSEHLYCMREMPKEDLGKWVCEVCQSNNQTPSSMFLQSKQPCGTSMGISLNRPPKNSKVQYIEPEVAKSLASGGGLRNNSSSPSKNCSNRSPTSMKKPFFSKMNTFSSPNPNFSIKPSSPIVSNMRKCLKDDSLRAATDVSGQRHCEESVPKKRVSFGILPKPGASSGADYCAEPQPNNIDSKGIKSPNVTTVSELDKYLPNHPAISPTWKGTFEIKSFSSIGSVQAHPPCKVHKNVLTFSKKLPESLKLEMLPRKNYWVEMFENDVPNELDIGLYFLSPFEHEQSYSSFIMHLDEHDLLLRSVVYEVELFVFSSKHLPKNSLEMNQRHFLWGLCRKSEE